VVAEVWKNDAVQMEGCRWAEGAYYAGQSDCFAPSLLRQSERR
jgi:hypothetical protein